MQNEIGIVNINLKRGNNKVYTLSFFNVDALGIETPKDLRVYNSIKMDIKKRTEVETASQPLLPLPPPITRPAIPIDANIRVIAHCLLPTDH